MAKKAKAAEKITLTKKQIKSRLEQLRKIAEDPDTCEMEILAISHRGHGTPGQGVWTVGKPGPARRKAR